MSEIGKAADRVFGFSSALRRYASSITDLDSVLGMAEALAAGRPTEPPGIDLESGDLSARLRQGRKATLVASAVAEQATGDPRTTFEFLTSSAQKWIAAAFEAAFASTCASYGIDVDECAGACPWAVLGLGKLGAFELNPSSDVDLMVIYGSDEPLPSGGLTAHELYERVSREAAALLSEATADGFCLRVDFDLRPEGRAGALANSLDAIIDYYEQHGSPLDRMALTRVRPVAGDPDLGLMFLASIEPFVFPRSLVSGALGSLAGVLGRLRGVERRVQREFNLKTGWGGIRDVELFAAAFQLVHGGRLPELRTTRTLDVLAALRTHGLVEAADVEALSVSYVFLRRLEHLVQYREDRQTQDMPLTGSGLRAIASVFDDGMEESALVASLDRHRSAAALPADRLFGLKASGVSTADSLETILSRAAPSVSREAAARDLGFVDVEAALARLSRLRDMPSSPLHPKKQDRFPGLGRAMVKAVSRSVWPDGALEFMTRLARLSGNLRLFDLCLERPGILDSLVALGSSSRVVADALARDAGLALEQALTGFEGGVPDASELIDEVEFLVSDAGDDDAGERLAAFRKRHVVAIAISDLMGRANDEAVGRGLSCVADACIEGALRLALGREVEDLAVFGFGRLGGREMGYLSDLDLVFVHRDRPERLLPAVQRALGMLTVRGVAGSMYTLDLRLRPSGSQGPLLVQAGEFERFYLEDARGPELLGSLNMRIVAGDLGFGEPLAARIRGLGADRLNEPGAVDEVNRVRRRQHEGLEKTAA
ncbi:MAG: hypothetical protein GXP54_00685, partial [Deltaproteobacteria bacterium]|nr:hypothetical protein [Deltaproteobacteria bacterium]